MTATIHPERHKARKDEVEQALRRVLTGHSFRSSAQCQALLRYMVEHSLTQETEMLRERIIGIKVFGRPPDYDSGNDPMLIYALMGKVTGVTSEPAGDDPPATQRAAKKVLGVAN